MLAVLAFLLPLLTEAATVEVRVNAAPEAGDRFLVGITGHYADLHLGRSRHWKNVLIRTGEYRSIDVGLVNPVLNVGVSVSVYHPGYITGRARSRQRLLPLRAARFAPFAPRTWRDYMRAGGAFDNAASESVPGQVLGHLELFLGDYLPTVDVTHDAGTPSEATLAEHAGFLEELVAFAESHTTDESKRVPAMQSPEQRQSYRRNAAKYALERRVLTRELLRRARAWLSLSREQRVTVRALMEGMKYPQNVDEQLFTDSDRDRLREFLKRYREDHAARRKPRQATHWSNPDNGVTFHVAAVGAVQECAYLSITTDLTGVVPADLGDMTKQVKGRFCSNDSGQWRFK